MAQVQKTVFISYRRRSGAWALAIHKDLTHNGFDSFFDYEGIGSGDFPRIISENIKSRAHFLVLLTPSALQRCKAPGDWLRREIEMALATRRNIVPVMLKRFNLSSPAIRNRLTGNLAALAHYNALEMSTVYFDAAMKRLREDFLEKPLNAVIHRTSAAAAKAANRQKRAARAAPSVRRRELTADEWFERGFEATDPKEEIRCFTEVIKREPKDAMSYYNRATAYRTVGHFKAALRDFSKAIQLDANDAEAYNDRALVLGALGQEQRALKDYSTAIRLKPRFVDAYINRGDMKRTLGDRAGAIQDLTAAIRIKPREPDGYYNRALVYEDDRQYKHAVADYRRYLDLNGGVRNRDEAKTEARILKLEQKL